MEPAALVYSHSVSPRLQYVIEFLSGYYQLPFRMIYDEEKYISAIHPCKINYSYHRLTDDEIFIHSHALVFESSVRPVKTECFKKDGYTAFFKSEGDVGFDLFAGIFYLLSRYEEYLPHTKDIYGRYAHQNALAFKENFLQLPLVNIWLEHFRQLLAGRNSAFAGSTSTFSYIPTYDIDMAWTFRHKGFQRNAGGILMLLLKAKFRQAAQRIGVIRGKRPDPYDAYQWMDDLHHRYQLHPLYFFLVATDRGKYDRNIDTANAVFRKLILDTSANYAIGLHPSWASGDQPTLLQKEKDLLQQITEKKITMSRQHYIRMSLPATYQQLISKGITDDYSMGYGSINGFRASVAGPFFWYDLKNEEQTTLRIHPFCFMDANSFYEQQQSPEQTAMELAEYYHNIRSVNGSMITIWHNSFLGTSPEFKGWRELYEDFTRQVSGDLH